MRCAAKDSYPGCYDISSVRAYPGGGMSLSARPCGNWKEELGVTAAPQDLHECGLRRFRFESVFHGKPFKDNQVSKVFCLWLDKEAEDFTVQRSEIDYVKWFDLDEAIRAVDGDDTELHLPGGAGDGERVRGGGEGVKPLRSSLRSTTSPLA